MRKKDFSLEKKVKIMNILEEKLGKKSFNKLQEGKLFLFQWRMTSPHGFYLDSLKKSGKHFVVTKDYLPLEEIKISTYPAFEVYEHSKEKINISFLGKEDGRPIQTCYKLKRDYIETYRNSIIS